MKAHSRIDILAYLFLFKPLYGVSLGHFWFMEAYLAMLMVMPLISALFLYKKSLLVWVAALIYLSNQFVYSANLFLESVGALLGKPLPMLDEISWVVPLGGKYHYILLYVFLGALLGCAQKDGLRQRFLQPGAFALCLLMGLADLLWVYRWKQGSWTWMGQQLADGYLNSGNILMSVGVFGLLQWVGAHKWTRGVSRILGTSTMGIYCLHIPVIENFSRWMISVCGTEGALWQNAFKTAAVTAICLGLTLVCKKIPLLKKIF